MRKPQPFGSDHRAEVRLVADDEVGLPGRAQLEHLGDALARKAAHESLAQVASVALGVEWLERDPPGWGIPGSRAEGEHVEGEGAERAKGRVAAGERHRVTGGLRGTGDGEERLHVPASAGEREQDTHVSRTPAAPARGGHG